MISKEQIIKRFISYVTIDTESDPNSESFWEQMIKQVFARLFRQWNT